MSAEALTLSKCPGKCCAVFYFPYEEEDFKTRALHVKDGAYIVDMLIPLSAKESAERLERFGITGNFDPVKNEGHHFTCRHWDEDTRLCTDYENRPEMCRDYPYNHECSHGCDFTAADNVRAKWWGIKAKRRLLSDRCLGMRELERDRRRYART